MVIYSVVPLVAAAFFLTRDAGPAKGPGEIAGTHPAKAFQPWRPGGGGLISELDWPPPELLPAPAPRPDSLENEVTRLRRLTEEAYELLLTDVKRLGDEYTIALDDAGIATLLDPRRLATDTLMVHSRTILSQSNQALATYQVEFTKTLANIRPYLDKVKVADQAHREAFTRGYENALPAAMDQMAEYWQIQRRAQDAMAAMIEHLRETHGAWDVVLGELLFERQTDADIYNANLLSLEVLFEREKAWQADAAKRGRQSIDMINGVMDDLDDLARRPGATLR